MSHEPPQFAESPSRILVAEDEHLVATELTLTLSSLGFTVVGPATDGDAAVRLAQIGAPDMALLDIRMPVRDGLSAASEIYSSFGVPVIMLTAYSDPEQIKDAEKAGVFGYLVKPATEAQIRAAIGVAWGRFVAHATEKAGAEDLRRRLEERKIIEKAKWAIVQVHKVTEPDAMKLLQKTARDRRTPLIDVAKSVLEKAGISPT